MGRLWHGRVSSASAAIVSLRIPRFWIKLHLKTARVGYGWRIPRSGGAQRARICPGLPCAVTVCKGCHLSRPAGSAGHSPRQIQADRRAIASPAVVPFLSEFPAPLARSVGWSAALRLHLCVRTPYRQSAIEGPSAFPAEPPQQPNFAQQRSPARLPPASVHWS